MKRGTLEHPKTLHLSALLELAPYAADGVMDSLAQWAAKYAPDGAVGKWSDSIIARGITWDGEPAKLIAALVESCWLDADPDYRLLIHDWPDHCDAGVHIFLARSRQFFADGTAPKPPLHLLSSEERPEIQKFCEGPRPRRKRGRASSGGSMENHGETRSLLPSPLNPSPPRPDLSSPVPEGSPAAPQSAPDEGGLDLKDARRATWEAYSAAYERRYGVKPVRNARVNSQLGRFVSLVPLGEAPFIAAFFVEHNGALYVKAAHPVGLLLADAEKLRTEWATNRRVNGSQAHRNEATEANPFLALAAKERAEKGITH